MERHETLGLIAGNGKFPFLFARNAHKKNIKVIAAAVKGDTSWWLRFFVEKIYWIGPGELQKLFEFFKREGVSRVIMAGQVHQRNLFDERVGMDEEARQLFAAMRDRKADTIFTAVADTLQREGIQLLDSLSLVKDYLASKGTLTRRGPTITELADIEFGRGIALAMGAIDVGQTVVVKERAIVAIEAMEGTDKTILRGGAIVRHGAVVVKMSKPAQDTRFDIPVVGPRTIRIMNRCRAQCLAVEAGKTLIIDREETTRAADKAGICIVAV